MAKAKMDRSAFVGKLLEEQDGDTLREGIRVLGAGAHGERGLGTDRSRAVRAQRRSELVPQRLPDAELDTRVGTIELAIPKVRTGSYFPSLLEPRRRAERALQAVVQEAYVHGVSTRKVDDLLKAPGLDGMSNSAVYRICVELDSEVEARTPPTPPIEGTRPSRGL